MELNYGSGEEYHQSNSFREKSACSSLSFLPPNAAFAAINAGKISYWVIQNGNDVTEREKQINSYISEGEVTIFTETLPGKLGIKVRVKDEDCSHCESNDERGQNDFLFSNPSQEDIIKKLRDHYCANRESPRWR